MYRLCDVATIPQRDNIVCLLRSYETHKLQTNKKQTRRSVKDVVHAKVKWCGTLIVKALNSFNPLSAKR